MDRFEAWSIFASVAEHGSFAAAARALGKSPAAVTRAVAWLEDRLATRLLNRTTRSVALTDAGARFVDVGRRLLGEFEDLEAAATAAQAAPTGDINVTAPVTFGQLHVLPIVESFLREYPKVDVRLLLLDRVVSLVDEGLDVGVRIGQLPDSSLQAIRVGEVRRTVYGSPDYLAARGRPEAPHDLAAHDCVAFSAVTPIVNRWSFEVDGKSVTVGVTPRLTVNSAYAAIDAAANGIGLTRVLSYQATDHVLAGRLVPVLDAYEPPPLPIQLVRPSGRYLSIKVRLFIDRAVEILRRKFERP